MPNVSWRPLALVGLALSLAACSTMPGSRVPSHSGTNVELTPLGISAQAVASSTTLVVGQTVHYTISISGVPATPGQLRWTTTNAHIASVTTDGTIKGVAAGSATVRATLTTNTAVFIDFPVVVKAASTPTTPTTTTTAYAQKILSLTNAARAVARSCGTLAYPVVPALTLSSALNVAAQGHASDMASKNYFSHTSLDGRSFSQRITNAGYAWSAAGENIAAGQPTPEAVVAGWLASAGHCANIMSATFTQMGAGYATGGSYGVYWVQDFGKPR